MRIRGQFWHDKTSRRDTGPTVWLSPAEAVAYPMMTADLTTFIAEGGDTYDIVEGGVTYRVHEFTEGGNFDVLLGSRVVDYLVVAGGGSGGRCGTGGGGGAGGVIEGIATATVGSYPVIVGEGGVGPASCDQGSDGGNSSALGTVSTGGGGGGNFGTNGRDGGSGGGAGGRNSTSDTSSPGSGIEGQGYDGGDKQSGGGGGEDSGGGGGGASAKGQDADFSGAGDGGDGIGSSITGEFVIYGGGGGGATEISPSAIGYGGTGGGGDGGYSKSGEPTPVNAQSGIDGLGGGGGGATGWGAGPGGDGGSGIVIIRYRLKPEIRWEPVDAAAWYAADYEVLFQDVAETTPSNDDGHLVRRWNTLRGSKDLDARTVHSGTGELKIIDDTSRVRVDSGRPFNLEDLSIAQDVPGFTVFAVVEPLFGGTSHYGVVFGVYVGDRRDFRYLLRRNNHQWNCGGRRFDSQGFSSASGGTVSIGERTAIVGTLDYVNGIATVYQDGVQVAQNTSFHSGGNTEDLPSHEVVLGSHLAVTNIYNFRGDLFEVVPRKGVATTQEIEDFFIHARDHWGVELDA